MSIALLLQKGKVSSRNLSQFPSIALAVNGLPSRRACYRKDDDDDVYYPRGRRPKMMNDYGRLREATATTEREGATSVVRSDWGK